MKSTVGTKDNEMKQVGIQTSVAGKIRTVSLLDPPLVYST